MMASILFSPINCRARSIRASRSSFVNGLVCPERSGKAAIAGGTEPADAPCCARASDRKASRAAAEEPHKKFRRENIPHPTQARRNRSVVRVPHVRKANVGGNDHRR